MGSHEITEPLWTQEVWTQLKAPFPRPPEKPQERSRAAGIQETASSVAQEGERSNQRFRGDKKCPLSPPEKRA
jgi:hypothetical protein